MTDTRTTFGWTPGQPYSKAVTAKGLMFVSGAVAVDPETGAPSGQDIKEQTRLVLSNLRDVVEAAGGRWENCLKATVYLINIGDFRDMSATYTEFFQERPPARTTIAVAELSRPEFLVEIDLVVAAD